MNNCGEGVNGYGSRAHPGPGRLLFISHILFDDFRAAVGLQGPTRQANRSEKPTTLTTARPPGRQPPPTRKEPNSHRRRRDGKLPRERNQTPTCDDEKAKRDESLPLTFLCRCWCCCCCSGACIAPWLPPPRQRSSDREVTRICPGAPPHATPTPPHGRE